MALRCSSFHKNLSAFVDDELDSRKRKQMELHISECEDCRREAEKLRAMIGIVRNMERPAVPAYLWEGTRRKLEEASEQPIGMWGFRMPRWVFVPAGGLVLAALVYLLSSQFLFYGYKAEPISVTAYLQEHTISAPDQVLPSNPLSELAMIQTGETSEDTRFDGAISELDMLMEVHYGIYPTNGS